MPKSLNIRGPNPPLIADFSVTSSLDRNEQGGVSTLLLLDRLWFKANMVGGHVRSQFASYAPAFAARLLQSLFMYKYVKKRIRSTRADYLLLGCFKNKNTKLTHHIDLRHYDVTCYRRGIEEIWERLGRSSDVQAYLKLGNMHGELAASEPCLNALVSLLRSGVCVGVYLENQEHFLPRLFPFGVELASI